MLIAPVIVKQTIISVAELARSHLELTKFIQELAYDLLLYCGSIYKLSGSHLQRTQSSLQSVHLNLFFFLFWELHNSPLLLLLKEHISEWLQGEQSGVMVFYSS